MSLLFLDLETVPYDMAINEDDIIALIPGTIKKDDTRQKWLEENRDEAIKKIIKERSLNFLKCRIVCLSYAFNDEQVQAITGSEEEILKIFQSRIKEYVDEKRGGFESTFSGFTLVGHNIKGFDAPILFLRASKYNLHILQRVMLDNRKGIIDTMGLAVYEKYNTYVSLDSICDFLQIPTSKDKMDGSEVYQYFIDNKIQEIANYCNKDVEACRAVYNQLTI